MKRAEFALWKVDVVAEATPVRSWSLQSFCCSLTTAVLSCLGFWSTCFLCLSISSHRRFQNQAARLSHSDRRGGSGGGGGGGGGAGAGGNP